MATNTGIHCVPVACMSHHPSDEARWHRGVKRIITRSPHVLSSLYTSFLHPPFLSHPPPFSLPASLLIQPSLVCVPALPTWCFIEEVDHADHNGSRLSMCSHVPEHCLDTSAKEVDEVSHSCVTHTTSYHDKAYHTTPYHMQYHISNTHMHVCI